MVSIINHILYNKDCRLSLGLFGTIAASTVKLTPDQGLADSEAAPLLQLCCDGRLTHRLMPMFRAVHSHFLTLEVTGTVRPSQIVMR